MTWHAYPYESRKRVARESGRRPGVLQRPWEEGLHKNARPELDWQKICVQRKHQAECHVTGLDLRPTQARLFSPQAAGAEGRSDDPIICMNALSSYLFPPRLLLNFKQS